MITFRVAVGISILVLLLGASAATKITVPEDYAKIAWAVENSTAGDTIEVHSGTYYENVNVTQKLTLRGIGMPWVNAAGNGSAIMLFANGITLEGFKATGSDWNNSGILVNSNHNLIRNNFVSNNSKGIFLNYSGSNTIISNIVSSNSGNGISLSGSSHNSMSKNIVSNNSGNGISLSGSSYNSISKNNISNNNGAIYLRYSGNNTLIRNDASNNNGGISLLYSNNNKLIRNDASKNGDSIFLYYSWNNRLMDNNASSNNWDGIFLGLSGNNTLKRNNASNNNGNGIFLYYSSDYNVLGGNNVSNNKNGFYLSRSSNNNTLTGNNASNNKNGIILKNSKNNSIYNNYFVNVKNAYDRGKNTWNTSKKHGKNIIGGPYLGGNYWSDYTGEDMDGDGLGNTFIPYKSSSDLRNGGDYLPLSQTLK
jgi:parallel beta-helix repeat protein